MAKLQLIPNGDTSTMTLESHTEMEVVNVERIAVTRRRFIHIKRLARSLHTT